MQDLFCACSGGQWLIDIDRRIVPVEQRLIVSLELLSRDFNIEQLFASRPSPAAETDAHCRVVQQRQNRFCKLMGVSISDEEPVSPSTMASGLPPTSVATTGISEAMYSRMALENPSLLEVRQPIVIRGR